MKKKITLLMILMSIALLGILGFQSYWLYSSFLEEQQRLYEEVGLAVRNAGEKSAGESVLTFFKSQEGNKELLIKPYLMEKEEDLTMKLDEQFFEDTVQQETKVWVFNGNKKVHVGTHVFRVKQNSQEDKKDVNVEVDKKANITTEMVWGQHWLITHFDSLLRKEMLAIGIKDFAYGYWNKAEKTYVLSGNKQVIDHLDGKGIRIGQQFLTGSNASNLKVFLPSQYKMTFWRMSLPLTASLVLVLLISSCFAYALILIFNQKKLSEIKSDFINNMTHEFKTPISTVSLALEALLRFDMRKDDEKAKQYLGIAEGENRRLGQMVEKVLNVAASEKRELKLNLERLDMHMLIERAISNIRMQVTEKNGVIISDYKAEHPWILGDQVHLSNVIYNLIDNACKYAESAPEIRIITGNRNGFFYLSVEDNGIGIPKSEQAQVFEKFYRVPTGNVHNVKGFGLGLSYVWMVADRHQGQVTLVSQVGKGSTFTVWLPLDK
ncbi:HAMP domain-containing sensor histidine kinase [Limibacter armeniacum]|uniref:sensor histidine kinase n=1 Tax=Limibacter armeniacum TaxID=466084 RepID=UPI002FE6A81F